MDNTSLGKAGFSFEALIFWGVAAGSKRHLLSAAIEFSEHMFFFGREGNNALELQVENRTVS